MKAAQGKGLNDYSKAVEREATAELPSRRPPVYGDGTPVGACDLTTVGRVLYWQPARGRDHEPECPRLNVTVASGKTPPDCRCRDPWRLVVVPDPYDGTPGRLVRPSRTRRLNPPAPDGRPQPVARPSPIPGSTP